MNTGEKNKKGRVIFKGPKGGLYVIGPSGKPLYKFPRAPNVPRVPNRAPNVPRVQNKVSNKLLKILSNIRRSNKSIKTTIIKRNYNRINIRNLNNIKKVPFIFYINTKFNDNNRSFLNTKNKIVEQEWINNQIRYIESLNIYDKLTVQSYTTYSHYWIGPYLIKSIIPSRIVTEYNQMTPLFAQFCISDEIIIDESLKDKYYIIMKDKNKSLKTRYQAYESWVPSFNFLKESTRKIIYKEALDLYIKDLKRIISNAPPVKKTFSVFRGTQTDIFQKKPGIVHTMKSFSSTSLDWSHAQMYGDLIKIHLRPGTRALFLAPFNYWNDIGETEVLLNIGTKFYIHKRNVKRLVYDKKRNITYVSVYA